MPFVLVKDLVGAAVRGKRADVRHFEDSKRVYDHDDKPKIVRLTKIERIPRTKKELAIGCGDEDWLRIEWDRNDSISGCNFSGSCGSECNARWQIELLD